MSDDPLFAFNERDARRTAKVVRRVERLPEDFTSNPQPERRFSQSTILAKLTNEVNSKWDAIEVGFDGEDLVELSQPRRWGTGEDELGRLAATFDANSAAEDDIVVVFLKHNINSEGTPQAQWFFGATTPTPIGCHLKFSTEDGDLDVTVISLLGGNADTPMTPGIQSKYLTFFDGPDDDGTFPCLFLDVDCATLPPALSGWGLQIQTPIIVDEPCKMMIDLDDDCDVLNLDVDGLSFDADPLAGNGLINLFDCELSILIDPVCDVLTVGALGLSLDITELAGTGLKEDVLDACQIQLGLDTLAVGDLTTRVDFGFYDGDLAVHHKGQFRDEGGYVTLNNQLLAHNSAEDFVWIDGDEAINLTGATINVLRRFSIELDSSGDNSNSLQFINDKAAPGNNFFYGTNDVGTKNWIDLDTLAGDGITFDTNFDVDPKNSIEINAGQLQLVGDETPVSARKYYGTNTTADNLGYHLGDAVTVVSDIISLTVSGTTVTINFETIALRVLDGSATPAADTATHIGEECTT